MTKKITLFLMVLLSGVSLAQTASAGGQLSSSINEYKSVDSNNCFFFPGYNCTACSTFISFTLNWSKTLASNGQWGDFVWAHSATGPWTIVGWPNDYQGTYMIGTTQGQLCPSQIQQLEQSVNNAQWQVSSYFTPTNGTTVLVNSNTAQIIIPSALPLPATALVSFNRLSLLPDPVNIFTGEAYFSSTDFSFKVQGPALALFRQYRSLSTFSGMFGYGWRTDFDVNLTQDSNGNVTIFNGKGTGIYFMNSAGTYTPSPGNFSTLTKNVDNTFTLTDQHGLMTHYDINGRLSSRTDRNGNTLTFVYNPAMVGGTYIQDAGGRQIKLYFDSNHHIISAQDPAGHLFQYGYDMNGNLVSIIDPAGAVTNYNYDSTHKIIQFTNANGHKTYYQYDAQGRVEMYSQANNVNKFSLNYQANNTTVVTDSLGNTNIYVFDRYGLLISHIDPLAAVTRQTWDDNMDRTSLTDARNNVTNFAYDSKGNLVQITDPLGNQTKMTYTPNFNLISSKTDALGQVTNFVYDIKGNLTSITDALGKNHSFVYDKYGNVIASTDSLRHSTNFTYDAFGHVLQKTDALGYKTIFTYDTDGNILTKTDALNHTTNFQYDNLNRLLKTTFADASTVSFGFDAFGNQISVTDQRGNTLTKTYDAFERISQTKDPLGGMTQFNYDTDGRLLALTDANGHQTTYTYDPNGKILTQTNALNFSTVFTYDLVGNVSTRTDANGKTTAYTYDALNRLTKTAYPDGTSVANVYDAMGRRTSMTDSRGLTTYTYDALSQLLSKTDPGANSAITYTYDSEGNRLTSVDQNNRTITNTYDVLNRLVSVTDTQGTTLYSYDAVSNRLSVKSPNGVTESYTYDALNRVLTAVNATAEKKIISSFSNVYDVAGMITKKTFRDGPWVVYSYDALNRLLEEAKQTSSSTIYDDVYTYDALGNRLSWTKNRMVRRYNYDAANRLTHWNDVVKISSSTLPVETTTYTYDQNGNRIFKQKVRTGKESRTQETTYVYDFENRLTGLNDTHGPGIRGHQTDHFTYSGEGLRTQGVRDNVTVNYLYDGLHVLVERDAFGNTTKSYTRAGGFPGGIGGLIAQNSTTQTNEDQTTTTAVAQYYDYNDLGSVADLTTQTGTVARRYSYDAFGNLFHAPARDEQEDEQEDTRDDDGTTNSYLFSTKEFEAREGLYYFGGRYYDPEVGRWLTPDPLGYIDGLNVYTYVSNNPVNLIDPYGLMGERLYQGALGFFQGTELGAGVVGILALASLSTGVPEVVATGAIIADVSGTIAGTSGFLQGAMTHNYYQAGTSLLLLGVGQVVNVVGPATKLYQNVGYNYAAGRFTQGGLFINTVNGANNTILKSTINSTVGSAGGIGASVVGANTSQTDNSDNN